MQKKKKGSINDFMCVFNFNDLNVWEDFDQDIHA